MENQTPQEVPAQQTTDYVQQLDQASKSVKEAWSNHVKILLKKL